MTASSPFVRGVRSTARTAARSAMLGGMLMCGLLGCRRAPSRVPYPHESLLSALAEARVAMRADPYADPPGTDLDGRNIYRLTLERIAGVQDALGSDYADILEFARAECHERLGHWAAAARAFEDCAAAGTALAEDAARRGAVASRLASICADPEGATTIDAYLAALEARTTSLEAFLSENPSAPYGAFARHELERVLSRHALLLFSNRYAIAGGAARALELTARLLKENAGSARVSEHRLLAADFHETLARDHARLNDPSGTDFDPEAWAGPVGEARRLYREVARTDGDPLKPEAQARLRALDAMAARVARAAK